MYARLWRHARKGARRCAQHKVGARRRRRQRIDAHERARFAKVLALRLSFNDAALYYFSFAHLVHLRAAAAAAAVQCGAVHCAEASVASGARRLRVGVVRGERWAHANVFEPASRRAHCGRVQVRRHELGQQRLLIFVEELRDALVRFVANVDAPRIVHNQRRNEQLRGPLLLRRRQIAAK